MHTLHICRSHSHTCLRETILLTWRRYACVFVCVYIYMCMYMPEGNDIADLAEVCMCFCVCICMYVCIYVYIYIYTHMCIVHACGGRYC